MKKNMVKPLLTLLVRLMLAVAVAAIVLAGACILMEGDMAEIMTAVFLGPLEDEYAIAEILREMVPLIFTGVAVSLMVRCGQFNMFVEGAFFGGAFLAGVLAPILGEHFIITPVIAILAAAVAMGLIGYVPAKMKSSLGVNEFVSSLMLNYIVYWVVMYLIHGVAADQDYPNATLYLEDAMRLPFLNEDIELSSNLVIALVVAVLSGLFLFKTKWGYALRMTGDNPTFAVYSGIKAQSYVTSSQVIGSALAGMGGAVPGLSARGRPAGQPPGRYPQRGHLRHSGDHHHPLRRTVRAEPQEEGRPKACLIGSFPSPSWSM